MIHSDLVQWYGNGQSYHDVNNDGYEDILIFLINKRTNGLNGI